MNAPRVTAVITCYNYGRFVREAIESVLAQGLSPAELEVVVVDDGSTDDTPERVRQFDGRITSVRKPNGGQASALNAGFANAHADIVALLDADDVWLPGKLERVLAAFEEHPAAVMVQHARVVWFAGTGKLEREPAPPILSGAFPPLPEDLLRYGPTATSALAFRKSLLGGLLPVPEVLTGHADSYLSALAVLKGPVISLDQPLAKYRIHEGNLYSFDDTEGARAARRLAQMQTFVEELERAFGRLRGGYSGVGLDRYLKRFHLIEETHRFATQGANRKELFRHLQKHRSVYGSLWTRRYRAYRLLMSYAGLLLGYRTFASLRRRHGQGGSSLRLRRQLLPAGPVESLSS
jgi:glycosyltransferase involved in cell wall biosynthesis